MALKLLRITFRYELPSPAWSGWVFHSNKLWTPEGYGLTASDGAYWSLLVRRAETATEYYQENQRLRQILAAGSARELAGRGQARESAEAVGECPTLAQDAPAAAARSAVDLSNGHYSTHGRQNPVFMRPAVCLYRMACWYLWHY